MDWGYSEPPRQPSPSSIFCGASPRSESALHFLSLYLPGDQKQEGYELELNSFERLVLPFEQF